MLFLIIGCVISSILAITNHEEATTALFLTIVIYSFVSVMGAVIRPQEACTKTYGIDYVFYTKLLCEVKE